MPLDNNYDDTLYFANKGAQYSWFSSSNNAYLKYTFDTQTYQRVNSGVFRCSQPADDLYDCNYMIFKNTSYGSKWFFAFITSVEYDNNQMSLVYYEIDYIQTYLYDGAVLEDCMIEREHTATDVIGEHILPEPVECGDYYFADYGSILDTNDHLMDIAYIAVVVCEATSTASPIPSGIYDNIFCGGDVRIFNTSANSEIADFLKDYVTSPQSIVSLYMIPRICLGPNVTVPNSGLSLSSGDVGASVGVDFAKPAANWSFQGSYVPKNKKLYTYPYCFFQINTPDGNARQFKYEFFSGQYAQFTVSSCIMSPVQVKLEPIYYKGSGTELNHHYTNESLVITGYPMCGWSYDSYTAWQAMNTVPMLVNAGMSMAGGAASGGVGGVATAGVRAAADAFTQTYQAKQLEGIPQGSFASGNVDFAKQRMQFYGGRCMITAEYAKAIDGFFSAYGYKVNRLGTPALNNRPHWTYVKTIGCKVRGTCPGDAIQKICQVFDKGITFWVTASEVGNYSLNNAPV